MLASAQPVSSRSSGVRLEDFVAVPIDVGKHKAMAKVVDSPARSWRSPLSSRSIAAA
jgi:hypothetical protein